METITIYQCEDGSRFNNRIEAFKYEKLLEECKSLNISPEIKDIDFTNGKGFIQHSVDIKPMLEQFLVKKCNEINNTEFKGFAPIIGRYIDNYNCLWSIYTRWQCIDDKGREFGQPYFKNHPEEAVLKQLN